MSDLRKERIGYIYAARLLDVSVTELKTAFQQGTQLRGHPLPEPVVRNAGRGYGQPLFYLGDIMDLSERL